MDCPNVTTLDQAMADLPSSVLPIKGLRRDSEGTLTDDAIQTIVDGLKSRGINPAEQTQKRRIIKDLVGLLCTVKKQYGFLMDELGRRIDAEQPIQKEFVETIRTKNLFLQDILTVARHIDSVKTMDAAAFIEGWQNMLPPSGEVNPMPPAAAKMIEQFQAEREMLDSKNYVELRKHRLEILREKNKTASNNLGLYGFMNLVAVGLLIYIAAAGSS